MIFANHFSKRVVPREYKQKLQKKIPPRKDSLSFRGFFVLFRKYCIRLNEKAVHPIEQKPWQTRYASYKKAESALHTASGSQPKLA